MKKIFTLLFVALMGMSFSLRAQDAQPNAIYPAFTAEDEDWTPNLLVDEPITVENYDDYFIIQGWMGAEGYDLKVAYDEDENITSITPITDGVEGTTVTRGYSSWLDTGNDEWYSACFYVGAGYGYATSSEDEGGYAIITVYAASEEYPDGEIFYYYLWWDQSMEQIQTAAFDDTESLSVYVEQPMLTMDALDEADPLGEPTALYIAAGNVIDKAVELNNLVEAAARTAMTETGRYESPLTEEVMSELDDVWKEYEELLLADYNDDIQLLQGVQEIITTIQDSEDFPGFAKAHDDEISALCKLYEATNDAVQAALEDIATLGYYVSPTKDVQEAVTTAMGLNSQYTEDLMAIDNASDADIAKLQELQTLPEQVLDTMDPQDDAYFMAEYIYDEIGYLMQDSEDAREYALETSGVYESPLTDDVIEDIEAMLHMLEASVDQAADIAILQELYTVFAVVQSGEYVDEEDPEASIIFPAFPEVNEDAIAAAGQKLQAAFLAAQGGMQENGTYEGPSTDEITAVRVEVMGLYTQMIEEYTAICNAYNADVDKVFEYYTSDVEDIYYRDVEASDEQKAAVEDLVDLIDAAHEACWEASEEALYETAEYVSPLTDEVMDALKAAYGLFTSGINGVAIDSNATIYFDLNGRRVMNPDNGTYIKVVNGKATKVLVK